MDNNDLTGKLIGAAMTVHSALGPGLLESGYRVCLTQELWLRVYPGSGAGPRILVGTGVHTFAYPLIPQCVSPIGRTSPTPSGRS